MAQYALYFAQCTNETNTTFNESAEFYIPTSITSNSPERMDHKNNQY